jgi:hypothetical protein
LLLVGISTWPGPTAGREDRCSIGAEQCLLQLSKQQLHLLRPALYNNTSSPRLGNSLLLASMQSTDLYLSSNLLAAGLLTASGRSFPKPPPPLTTPILPPVSARHAPAHRRRYIQARRTTQKLQVKKFAHGFLGGEPRFYSAVLPSKLLALMHSCQVSLSTNRQLLPYLWLCPAANPSCMPADHEQAIRVRPRYWRSPDGISTDS